MRVLRQLPTVALSTGTAITIGNFDGMHRGHLAILGHLKQVARDKALKTVVVLFEPHPQAYFTPDKSLTRLMSFREKVVFLRDHGIDYVVCLSFNQTMARCLAKDFVAKLIRQLQGRAVIVGDDFRFGAGRAGDFPLLVELGKQLKFEAKQVSALQDQTIRVSSTQVREALRRGQLLAAQRYLGRDFSIQGRVAHGDKRARQWGMPTANIRLKHPSALRGVFVVDVFGAGLDAQPGVANLGVRPTVDGKQLLLEVHLFEFDRNIYGQRLRVVFREKLRDEKRFEAIDALKLQLQTDAQQAKHYFGLIS